MLFFSGTGEIDAVTRPAAGLCTFINVSTM